MLAVFGPLGREYHNKISTCAVEFICEMYSEPNIDYMGHKQEYSCDVHIKVRTIIFVLQQHIHLSWDTISYFLFPFFEAIPIFVQIIIIFIISLSTILLQECLIKFLFMVTHPGSHFPPAMSQLITQPIRIHQAPQDLVRCAYSVAVFS